MVSNNRLWHLTMLNWYWAQIRQDFAPFHHQQPDLLIQERIDPTFMLLTANDYPYLPNVTAEIETLQTRQPFSSLLLSSFGEPVQIVVLVS